MQREVAFGVRKWAVRRSGNDLPYGRAAMIWAALALVFGGGLGVAGMPFVVPLVVVLVGSLVGALPALYDRAYLAFARWFIVVGGAMLLAWWLGSLAGHMLGYHMPG